MCDQGNEGGAILAEPHRYDSTVTSIPLEYPSRAPEKLENYVRNNYMRGLGPEWDRYPHVGPRRWMPASRGITLCSLTGTVVLTDFLLYFSE